MVLWAPMCSTRYTSGFRININEGRWVVFSASWLARLSETMGKVPWQPLRNQTQVLCMDSVGGLAVL